MGLVPLEKRVLLLFMPCDDPVEKVSSMNQEEGFQQTPNLLGP